MSKRVAALLMAVVLFLTCAPLEVSAAEPIENSVVICCNGVDLKETVLQRGDGKVFAPLSWITYYGLMLCKESEDEYEYYFLEQRKLGNYAKRIFINKKDNSFSVCLYFKDSQFFDKLAERYETILYKMDKNMSAEKKEEFISQYFGSLENVEQKARNMVRANFLPIYEGEFSEKIDYGDKIWVPMEELLPLLDVAVDISAEDGCIYMETIPVSITKALYRENISSVTFDADRDIAGDKVISCTSYVIDAFMSDRLNRFNVFENTGRIEDYENVFKNYLVDDEIYLSAFDKTRTPEQEEIAKSYLTMKKYENVLNVILDTADVVYDVTKGNKNVKSKKKGIESFFNPWEEKTIGEGVLEGGDILSRHAYKSADYWYTYNLQVEDHRKMLGAVYYYNAENAETNSEKNKIKEWPSYKAAKKVEADYSKCVPALLNSVSLELKKGLFDRTLELLTEDFAPYKLTSSATKLILQLTDGGYENIESGAVLEMVDNSVDISYQTFIRRMNENKFDAEFLNDLRLSAIMTLLSSRYAYKTYWEGDAHAEEIEKINEMLKDFYLAADGIECDSSDGYDKNKKELKSQISYLRLEEGSAKETSEKVEVGLMDLIDMTEEQMMQFDWEYYDYAPPVNIGGYSEATGYLGALEMRAYFYDTPEFPEPCPAAVVMLDTRGGTGKIELIEGITTGMSYYEVYKKFKNSEVPHEDYSELSELASENYMTSYQESTASAYVYIEQGTILILYFDGTEPDSVLVGGELSFFE